MRRVEALVGSDAYRFLAREHVLVAQLSEALKVRPEQLPERVNDLVEKLRNAEKEIEKVRMAQLLAAAGELAANPTDVYGVRFVGHRVDGANAGDVRKLSLDIRGRIPASVPAVSPAIRFTSAARMSSCSASELFNSSAATVAVEKVKLKHTLASAELFRDVIAAAGYSNTVLSADSFHRFTEQDTVRFQIAGSRSNGSLEGHSLLASYDHNDRDWFWAASYGETAPQFRADSGLFNQVGIREGEAEGYRRIRGGPDRWFTNLYLELSADTTTEWNGDWTEWGSDIAVT